ncbi:MFS transporter [Actinomycetospora lutea]|uniref:MFS transporter n=1 Tax=Actinomycetospora lutea TaxID=663604 RepID=UPI002366A6AF|nr:MFS transporter [Actinomycetospora lutea]MDD7940901.1 MFS transporter [Actinomycetospora lutea]
MTEVPKNGSADRKTLQRVAFASAVGTTIEFYDFFIYGTAAALVFPKIFFPALGATAGTVASFATFAVAFVARPVGALFFGHFGDRIGRKRTLVVTLLVMGTATVAIGLLPGASTIGAAAPVALVVLRFAQGFAVGGEWAGAVLLTAEYAPPGKRGLYAIFPQLGAPIAFALASGTFLVTGLTLGDADQVFLDYGWRIPFLLSIVLVGAGLYVRLKISETPVFQQARGGPEASALLGTTPLLSAIRNQGRAILLGGGSGIALFAFFYMGTAYLTSFGTSPSGAGLSRPAVLTMGIVAGIAFGATTIVCGWLSDRVGRKRLVVGANAVAVAWGLLLFPVLGIGTAWAFGLGLVVTLAIVGVQYGPAGALLPELFETRHRYTGAGAAYNLSAILGGAVPPLIAAPLAAAFGPFAIGIMLCILALVSVSCAAALPETRSVDMTAAARASA